MSARTKVFLKSLYKTISSIVCTLKVPNFLILPEYDCSFFNVKCPPFKFANATWRFDFSSDEERDNSSKRFLLFMERLNYEIPKQRIFYTVTLLDDDGEDCDEFAGVYLFEKNDGRDEMASFNSNVAFYNKHETLTMVVHLFCDQLTEVNGNSILLPTMDNDAEVLSLDFKKLFLKAGNHDLILRVPGKEFKVHQDILKARSEVFEAMLSHDIIKKTKGIINVPDCDPEAMEQFLFYLYSGKVETLNQDNAFGLYYAAEKYSIVLLKTKCSGFIKKSLSPSNICEVIQLAIKHNDIDLINCATDYFLNHTSSIFRTLKWMSFMTSHSSVANGLLIKASEKWDCSKS